MPRLTALVLSVAVLLLAACGSEPGSDDGDVVPDTVKLAVLPSAGFLTAAGDDPGLPQDIISRGFTMTGTLPTVIKAQFVPLDAQFAPLDGLPGFMVVTPSEFVVEAQRLATKIDLLLNEYRDGAEGGTLVSFWGDQDLVHPDQCDWFADVLELTNQGERGECWFEYRAVAAPESFVRIDVTPRKMLTGYDPPAQSSAHMAVGEMTELIRDALGLSVSPI
ncbi:MAG: hypothetical protein ACR2RB_18455 [Gammaproteobacteria bacterium]